MVDLPKTLESYRMPWRRDPLKQGAALAPVMRYAARHPALLVGAAVVGLAGVLAWRNREKIGAAAQPVLDDARHKGQALLDDAKAKGEALVDQARTAGEKVAARARTRRTAAAPPTVPDLH
ncbi:hypothetical protein [Phenylobacterium sp. SCN 70-31]|uniref:hypothetical protein n=1 Tax=Phenylobacterium sp. SCN 70-31 TaxID=1660129 RepID=UPI00086AEE03|nr:hypothetical protein [Phenylobacterium sp. SCN 70-31]ODT87877.1 MAG: hypothetical protein ABS78_09865 [Phenylobacterium sp. SCN 70-31]